MSFARYVLVLYGLVASSLAFGASQRTFVSTSGVNNLTCSIGTPCRDFAAAVAATSPDGEVIVLDSGGYGGVTIAQSVSIIAPPGVYAGISVFAGDGVTIAAGPADKVTLRGLTINGQGGNNGIVVTSAGEVNVEQCIVANLAADGIRINGGGSIHVRGAWSAATGATACLSPRARRKSISSTRNSPAMRFTACWWPWGHSTRRASLPTTMAATESGPSPRAPSTSP